MEYARLKDVSIENNVGNKLYVTCLVKGVEVRPMRTGGDSMLFTMKDMDVEYEARVFDVSEQTKQIIKEGRVYNIIMTVKPYKSGKGGISCIVENGNIQESTLPAEAFIDWVPDLNKYYEIIKKLMNYISDSVSGKIAYAILSKYWDKFTAWPAASGMHHTSFGGLMMHTACVAEKCYNDGNYYNSIYGKDFINVKLLVSAALLHDIMKVEEYVVDVKESKVEYSTNSCLASHVVTGAIEVRITAKELGLEDKQEVKELEHCLLAHHGSLEYGSPVTPNMPEAFILHYADMLDVETWRFNKAFKGLQEHQSKHEWINGSRKIYYRPTISNDILNVI